MVKSSAAIAAMVAKAAALSREWSTKEQLYLTSCVVKFGENNWGAVAKQMGRLAAEDTELSAMEDAFSQAACAAQFSSLLDGLSATRGSGSGGGRRSAAAAAIDSSRRGRSSAPVALSTETTKQLLSQLTLDRMGQLESLIVDGEDEMERLERDIMQLAEHPEEIEDADLIAQWRAQVEADQADGLSDVGDEDLNPPDLINGADSVAPEASSPAPLLPPEQPPLSPLKPTTPRDGGLKVRTGRASTEIGKAESPVVEASAVSPVISITSPKAKTPRSSPRKRTRPSLPTPEDDDESLAKLAKKERESSEDVEPTAEASGIGRRTSRRSRESGSGIGGLRSPRRESVGRSGGGRGRGGRAIWSASSSEERKRGGSDTDWRAWQRRAQMAHRLVCDHRHANIFLNPIKDRDAPGYSDLIKMPMDLKLLKHLVDSGQESSDKKWLIRSTPAYLRALRYMFANAVMYNQTNSEIANMAREMDREVVPQATEMLELGSALDSSNEGQTDAHSGTGEPTPRASTRRSTRTSSAASRGPGKRGRDHIPTTNDSPTPTKRAKRS